MDKYYDCVYYLKKLDNEYLRTIEETLVLDSYNVDSFENSSNSFSDISNEEYNCTAVINRAWISHDLWSYVTDCLKLWVLKMNTNLLIFVIIKRINPTLQSI